MKTTLSRRCFLKTSMAAAAGMGPFLSGAEGPASQRVRLGIIGCGGRGRQLIRIFQQLPNVEVVSISDVIEPRLDQTLALFKDVAIKPERYVEHERILERQDIDAVVIATTQHWHGLPHIQAAEAGKSIFVEKPLSHTVVEGRAMVAATRRHGVLAMMGTQQRGGPHWIKAVELIQAGRLGKVTQVECWNFRSVGNRVGRPPDAQPPPGYHWDRWLGPAPKVPFNPARLNNTWWFDYSGGMLNNWAIHHIDIILWAMQAKAPAAVSCSGGKFLVDDLADCPDTVEALWEFPGWLMQYRFRGTSNFRPFLSRPKSHGLCFHGTQATMFVDRDGYEIWNDDQFDSWNTNPTAPVERMENKPFFPSSIGNESDGQWQRLFLESIREGKPTPLDLERSHQATICCHLANIAYLTGRKIKWDGHKETIVDDVNAAGLLSRPRRPGYELPVM